MDEEIKEDKTSILKKLMKSRMTKKIVYKGIYTNYEREILQ